MIYIILCLLYAITRTSNSSLLQLNGLLGEFCREAPPKYSKSFILLTRFLTDTMQDEIYEIETFKKMELAMQSNIDIDKEKLLNVLEKKENIFSCLINSYGTKEMDNAISKFCAYKQEYKGDFKTYVQPKYSILGYNVIQRNKQKYPRLSETLENIVLGVYKQRLAKIEQFKQMINEYETKKPTQQRK